MITGNPKLEAVLAELKRCEAQAIADESYAMPTRKAICDRLGIGRSYFRSGTEPSQVAYAALQAAQDRLDRLPMAPTKAAKDTILERCCGCFKLRKPALSRPVRVYGKAVVKHLCPVCLDKQNNQRAAA